MSAITVVRLEVLTCVSVRPISRSTWFVCGLTGAGKTTTVKEILAASDVPFLVLESAKRDYRQLLGCPSLEKQLRIYTPGDTTIAPLRLNPFHIMYGVQAGVHIDYLKAIFNASFSLYGPMPYIR